MTSKYFKLTPITEKPEKADWYYVRHDNESLLWQTQFVNGRFTRVYAEFVQKEIVEWLKPLPADTMVISEEKLRSLLKIAHDRGYIDGSANNSAPPDFNQLITKLKEQQ